MSTWIKSNNVFEADFLGLRLLLYGRLPLCLHPHRTGGRATGTPSPPGTSTSSNALVADFGSRSEPGTGPTTTTTMHRINSTMDRRSKFFSPTSGSQSGGATVTIQGAGFTDATTVSFGGTPTTVISIASNSRTITVTAPEGTAGKTVDVTVTSGGTTTKTGSSDRFTYS